MDKIEVFCDCLSLVLDFVRVYTYVPDLLVLVTKSRGSATKPHQLTSEFANLVVNLVPVVAGDRFSPRYLTLFSACSPMQKMRTGVAAAFDRGVDTPQLL